MCGRIKKAQAMLFTKFLERSFLAGYDPCSAEVQRILDRSDLEAMQSDMRKVSGDMQKAFDQLKTQLNEPQRALKSTSKRPLGC
jgi:predicted Zn-dependent protease